LFHYFDRFLTEYESRFEKPYGFLRPIIKEVVERYLDCGNPRCGFARIRCPDCHAERFLMFSCRTRGFCPSCHAKRLEEWHLHFLVKEGGVDEAGLFHKVPRFNDSWLAEIFVREVLADLIGRELLSPEWADRLLSWRHTGFNVHSRVRAKTRHEAERVGKYLIRPLLSLERLSLDERTGQARYQYGKEAKETERMDYLEFIARTTFHIPDRGQVTVRYYGLYANAHRGKVKKASQVPVALGMIEEELRPIPFEASPILPHDGWRGKSHRKCALAWRIEKPNSYKSRYLSLCLNS
jgi:ribosomal protein S27E